MSVDPLALILRGGEGRRSDCWTVGSFRQGSRIDLADFEIAGATSVTPAIASSVSFTALSSSARLAWCIPSCALAIGFDACGEGGRDGAAWIGGAEGGSRGESGRGGDGARAITRLNGEATLGMCALYGAEAAPVDIDAV
jgi:hypothetical protein